MARTTASTAVLLMAAVALSGCVSATPRPYGPVLRPPPGDPAAFERAFRACAAEVAAGKRSFGQSGGAMAVGAVGGVATVQVLGGAAAAGAVGGSAALAATGVGLLLAVPLATYSLSSARRKRNEREIQQAMTACLAQDGHAVSAWTRMTRAQTAAATTTTPTRSARP